MVLRPTSPLSRSADVERRERSWVIAAGKRQFSITRIEHRASFSAGYRIEASATCSRWRPTAILGSLLGVLGGATLLGLAINSSRADAGYRYVVSVPIPPARKLVARTQALPVASQHAITSSMPAALAAKRGPQATVDDAAPDYVMGDLDTVEATALATSMSGAIAAAMATGHLQQWSSPDGAERGFVVVGPAQEEDGCRSLSILTRSDGDNKVESRRECRPAPKRTVHSGD